MIKSEALLWTLPEQQIGAISFQPIKPRNKIYPSRHPQGPEVGEIAKSSLVMPANQLTGRNHGRPPHRTQAIERQKKKKRKKLRKPIIRIWQKTDFLPSYTGPSRVTCSQLHLHASFWSFKYWFLKFSSGESPPGTSWLGLTNGACPATFIAGQKYRLFPLLLSLHLSISLFITLIT